MDRMEPPARTGTGPPPGQGGPRHLAGVRPAAPRGGARPSGGSVGDSDDNAVAGSSFATLKTELVYRRPWPTRAAARSAIFEYVEVWYNRRRRHSTLGDRSPAQYESQYALATAAVDDVAVTA